MSGFACLVITPLADIIGRKHGVIRQDAWYGGRRTVFDFEGYLYMQKLRAQGVSADSIVSINFEQFENEELLSEEDKGREVRRLQC